MTKLIQLEGTKNFYYENAPTTFWKPPVNPVVPQHCVQIFAVDYEERFMFIHRSPNVRSAANVWSTPTGLHDIGYLAQDVVAKELHEEFALQVSEPPLCIGQYENIAGDPQNLLQPHATPQFHWVMSVYVAVVHDLYDYKNMEPDKHDEVAIVPLSEIPKFVSLHEKEFHPSLYRYMSREFYSYFKAITTYLEEPAF